MKKYLEISPPESTNPVTARYMVNSAKPRRGDVLVDLGSGEGDVLFMAVKNPRIEKIFGLEANDDLLKASRKYVKDHGYGNRIKILNRDLTKLDLSKLSPLPTIATMHFTWGGVMWVKEKLEKGLASGARVVSNRCEVTGWRPTEIVYPPGTDDTVYVYEMGCSDV